MADRKEKKDKKIGEVRIKAEVIAALVSSCVREFEEVKALGSSFAEGIKQVLSKKRTHRGIKVEIENNSATIYISVVMKYGESIQEITRSLQYRVKEEIERMSGVKVNKVNVVVESLSYNNKEER